MDRDNFILTVLGEIQVQILLVCILVHVHAKCNKKCRPNNPYKTCPEGYECVKAVTTLIPHCVDSESLCKIRNREYQETLTETRAGIPCQRWDTQSPHDHDFTSADFPNETLAEAGNFCRNPDNEIYAWCYTTDEDDRWDFCDTIRWTDEKKEQCVENNRKYQETLTETRDGIPCQRWDSQSPHDHDLTSADFPDETLADAGNFCRNPDNSASPWCYTTDEDERWDYCDILKCVDEKNWQYQKGLTKTHSGIPCQRWDTQSPHDHDYTSADFPDETLSDAGNFCRNPDNELYAWCFTTDEDVRWDYCDILYCPDENDSRR